MKIFSSLGRQKRYCVFSGQNRIFLFCLVSILTLLGTAPYANAQPGAITVEFSDIPLEEAFKVIEKKIGLRFLLQQLQSKHPEKGIRGCEERNHCAGVDSDHPGIQI